MFMGLGMPIPDLSNKPGPGRPGWGPAGSYDFQFKVTGAVTIEAFPNTAGQSFTIKWQDGTTAQTSGSSTINSPAGAGVISINNEDDNTYADEFKIVSGQANVTKVISWGSNAWSNVFEAFKDCVNLTDISTTSFLASGQGPTNGQGCYMTRMFDGCTSLLEVDIKNWNLEAGVSWKNGGPFANLVNLEKIDATGLKIKFQDNQSLAKSWFYNVGSATTNGCEFKLSGLDYSSTTNTSMIIDYIFSSVKFKDGSNLSNWKFPSYASSTYQYWFQSARISGTLDMSSWTTFNGSSLESMFYRFNQHLTAADGSKINMSNLGLTYATSFYRMFWECEISEIIGLNTWGATSGSLTNLREMFREATLMRINPSDNFSSAFTSSLNVDNVREMCSALSSGLNNADVGAAPSFAGADFSNMTGSFYWAFKTAKIINSPDFTTCTFSASNPINFGNIFLATTITDTNNHFILNNQNLAISYLSQSFWQTSIRRVTIGDNVDLSNLVSIGYMSYQAGFDTHGLTLPSDANYSSLTDIGQYAFSNGSLSTCQVDTFIRQNWATNLNTGLTCDLENNKITAAPSIARSNLASLTSVRSWNITVGSPDTALPFAYPSYAFDPSSTTSVTPSLVPSGAIFSTTTSGITVNSTTGVVSWASTFSGSVNVKCTYTDGCYNEIAFTIMTPFTMRTKIPAGSSNFTLSPQMSAGECFIDWGDTNSETLTGSTTHSYVVSGSDQEYDIKLFDSSSGSKFTGFNIFGATEASYERTILKWGDIEWQNNSWFGTSTTGDYRIRLAAPNGSDHKPNLSQVTSLSMMFGTVNNDTNIGTGFFEDTNDNLEHWDVSTITNMENMFRNPDPISTKVSGAENLLKCGNWDVSNVTNFKSFMRGYSGAVRGSWSTQTNIDMTNWDTSSATDMSFMFWQHSKNKIGIENFRTENVTNLSHFYGGGTWNAKTKMYNSILRWDVSNVEDFSSASIVVGTNETDTNANYPNNWRFSTDATKNLNFNKFSGGHYMRLGGGPYYLTDLQAFSTKTINETFYGGTSYTAWNMDNASNISEFGGSFFRGNPPLGLFRNYNIANWNITSKCTSFYNLWVSFRAAGGSLVPFDQDLSGWNVTGITGDQGYFMRGGTEPAYQPVLDVNMSTSNYDATLIGWGALAASVQSGVTVNFGTSKYTAGGTAEQGRTALVNAGWTIIDGGAIYSNTNALSFNGSTEYLTAGSFSLNNSAFSIQAYIKSSNTTDFQMIVGKTIGGSNPSNEQIQFRTETNENIKVILFGSTTSLTLESSGDNVLDGDWHSIVVTWSTSVGAKIYIDGTLRGTDTTNIGTLNSSTEDFLIGARNTASPTKFFNGSIDELMVWDNIISTGDIQAYANVIGSGSIPDPNAITGLQLWNRMGD